MGFSGEIAFVTSNPGKAREASHFLGKPVVAVPLDLPEIQSLDFAEVARAKAMAAAAALGRRVLAEDSGLEVKAWGGFPGPMTKWITEGPLGKEGLARMLDAFTDRSATAVSALALASPSDGPEDVLVAVAAAAKELSRHCRAEAAASAGTLCSPGGAPGRRDEECHAGPGNQSCFRICAADVRSGSNGEAIRLRYGGQGDRREPPSDHGVPRAA